ncbi:MAG TPA: hypothetical protein VEH77_19275 [Roseiarcus sp.]|nr:hypothetical protein [Roseiarcus sp.]
MTLALHNPSVIDADRSEAGASGLVVALIAVALFAMAAFTPAVLGDGDTWTHLATGEWIIAHGAVPRADPFSHSMPGAPWTAHEWLSEILFTLAFRAGGWSAVALLTAFAAAGAALVMGLRLARDLSGAALGVAIALGVGLWTPTLLARPHVLALPVAALWVVGLLSARDRAKAPPLVLALLMTVWSNLHGGFVIGLALIAPFACEAVLAADPGAGLAAARRWGLFALASLAAALVNPYGIEALLFPFRLIGLANLSRISEWSPQDFGGMSPMEAALIAFVGFALTRPMRVPPVRVALLAVLVAMALAHTRHAQLLGLVAPMLLAPPIAEAIGAPTPGGLRPVARTALAAALMGALALSLVRLAFPVVRTDGHGAPIAALAAVPPELKEKPVLNDYGFGGLLIFEHVPPFIDGRADMYGDAMLSLYRKLAAGDPAALEATLARYRIAWTIFPPDRGVVAMLDREPGWRRLYADDVAVVHIRADAAPACLADVPPQ